MSFVMLLTLGLLTSMRSLSSIASLSLSSAAYRHELSLLSLLSLVMRCESSVVIHSCCMFFVTLVGLCVLLKSLCVCKWCVATGFYA